MSPYGSKRKSKKKVGTLQCVTTHASIQRQTMRPQLKESTMADVTTHASMQKQTICGRPHHILLRRFNSYLLTEANHPLLAGSNHIVGYNSCFHTEANLHYIIIFLNIPISTTSLSSDSSNSADSAAPSSSALPTLLPVSSDS